MNIGSLIGGVVDVASKFLPALGPAGSVASLLIDPLKDLLAQALASSQQSVPDQAAQALAGNVLNGFLEGLIS